MHTILTIINEFVGMAWGQSDFTPPLDVPQSILNAEGCGGIDPVLFIDFALYLPYIIISLIAAYIIRNSNGVFKKSIFAGVLSILITLLVTVFIPLVFAECSSQRLQNSLLYAAISLLAWSTVFTLIIHYFQEFYSNDQDEKKC